MVKELIFAQLMQPTWTDYHWIIFNLPTILLWFQAPIFVIKSQLATLLSTLAGTSAFQPLLNIACHLQFETTVVETTVLFSTDRLYLQDKVGPVSVRPRVKISQKRIILWKYLADWNQIWFVAQGQWGLVRLCVMSGSVSSKGARGTINPQIRHFI